MITKLQPHFLSIWTYQSWNLAYNVAVEWDDPADKYQWMKKGIQFVQQGVAKDKRSPDLVWDTAWYYYHKIGFSDESIILRRYFRDDDDPDFKRYYDPEAEAGGRGGRQLQAGLRLVQPGGRDGERRRDPAARGHGREHPVCQPLAAAEGACRRYRLPVDAGARADPLRRGAGEDEHVRHPRPVRRAGQE